MIAHVGSRDTNYWCYLRMERFLFWKRPLWIVKDQYISKALRTFKTRDEAWSYCKMIAEHDRVTAYLQNIAGQIEQTADYRND